MGILISFYILLITVTEWKAGQGFLGYYHLPLTCWTHLLHPRIMPSRLCSHGHRQSGGSPLTGWLTRIRENTWISEEHLYQRGMLQGRLLYTTLFLSTKKCTCNLISRVHGALSFIIVLQESIQCNQIGVNRLDSLFVIIETFHFFIEKVLVYIMTFDFWHKSFHRNWFFKCIFDSLTASLLKNLSQDCKASWRWVIWKGIRETEDNILSIQIYVCQKPEEQMEQPVIKSGQIHFDLHF